VQQKQSKMAALIRGAWVKIKFKKKFSKINSKSVSF
jgi:hypothetical protein